ncbi:hypothetical protein [Burkholderia gladioli]|uniref:hypothetical protein n=1 Tax=Burkholderia gladioli TaxID=28095 RepID=UPI00163DF140|nr:hypothetical protein [Burkholderia gladioli]
MASKKGNYDHTRTERSRSHHKRIVNDGGKRVSVDMDVDRLGKIARLMEHSYGETKADVIRRAIDEASDRLGPDSRGERKSGNT